MCSSDQVQRYRSKISGPLLDRIDLHVEVARPSHIPYNGTGTEPEDSEVVRRRVIAARQLQLDRAGIPNAQLDTDGVRRHCRPTPQIQKMLESAAETMSLSPRACQRILKVARTLADLENLCEISESHLAEALAYRGFDGGKPG
jgi:magnesium chelatase family protein